MDVGSKIAFLGRAVMERNRWVRNKRVRVMV